MELEFDKYSPITKRWSKQKRLHVCHNDFILWLSRIGIERVVTPKPLMMSHLRLYVVSSNFNFFRSTIGLTLRLGQWQCSSIEHRHVVFWVDTVFVWKFWIEFCFISKVPLENKSWESHPTSFHFLSKGKSVEHNNFGSPISTSSGKSYHGQMISHDSRNIYFRRCTHHNQYEINQDEKQNPPSRFLRYFKKQL